MGIRSALKKELMNLDSLDLMTADDVRGYLQTHIEQVEGKSAQHFNLIARFNAQHNQIQSGLPAQKSMFTHQRHRLFKEVLYSKTEVQKWVSQHV
ncbi:hypothetical protein PA25_01140 [Pseudoalteromonas sp. A25]|uniref:hypothetical protein n=1 Tax=Pseudoalteromonas sp. A25 TaxID=116092 RepID=UPI001260A8A6|nr:hypothetical protein [Pseudoalteromonas sp. A25]BBN80129.1 hypothetical protein PA25_01140 [Pseudoalteromonas sp. A25]